LNPSRLSSAWLTRAAVAVVALAVPLFAVGSAQAAIAGAGSASTTNLPDLVSAKALDATDVQVCFDKALSSQNSDIVANNDYGDIFLVGYNSYSNYLDPSGARIDPNNGDCVDLGFSSRTGQLDLGQFSVVEVGQNAVAASTGGQQNLADSTTLLTSTTNNGTTGHTTAPDLTGPAPVPASVADTGANNEIEYVFDQSVDAALAETDSTFSKFWYEDINGNYCYGSAFDTVNSGGSAVYVEFPTTDVSGAGGIGTGTGPGGNAGCTTTATVDARRAGVGQDAVYSVSDDEVGNPTQGMAMPNNPGTTNLPDLTSATLSSNGQSVTFNFDTTVSYENASDFFVALSNGTVIRPGSSETPIGSGPDSITVTFPNLQQFDEYAVQAGVENGGSTDYAAYDTTNNAETNSIGAVDIGDNAKAFARGFTTGPDAYAASITAAPGGGGEVASIAFDQRVSGYDYGDDPALPMTTFGGCCAGNNQEYIPVEFLNAAGSVLGQPSSITIPAYPNPGPEAVSMAIPSDIAVQKPAFIAISPNANYNYTPYSGHDDYNDSCGFETGLYDFGPGSPSYTSGGGSYNYDTTYGADYYDGCSVPQIIAAPGAAAHVHGVKVHARAHSHKRAHRARRAHRAHKAHKRA